MFHVDHHFLHYKMLITNQSIKWMSGITIRKLNNYINNFFWHKFSWVERVVWFVFPILLIYLISFCVSCSLQSVCATYHFLPSCLCCLALPVSDYFCLTLNSWTLTCTIVIFPYFWHLFVSLIIKLFTCINILSAAYSMTEIPDVS